MRLMLPRFDSQMIYRLFCMKTGKAHRRRWTISSRRLAHWRLGAIAWLVTGRDDAHMADACRAVQLVTSRRTGFAGGD